MSRWRRPLRLAAALLSIAGPAAADLGGFVIDAFHTELTVERDADLIVEERIEVRFLEPRHGIYRTIPVRYTDPRGYGYSLGFRLLDVRDADGRPHRTSISGEGRYVKIRIGDPERTVEGSIVYRIRYRVRRALGHFPEHDEIYWNATGHEWQTRIERATTWVRLPGAVSRENLEAEGYAGRFGSRSANTRISFPESGAVWFEAPRPLEPLEGLTIVVAWPKGLVEEPGSLIRMVRFLGDNWIVLAPILALAWLLRSYRVKGRDPAGPGAVVVRYEAPPGVTAGEIGTAVDERVNLRDITATVVDLAVRGYLVIRVEEREQLLGLLTREEIVFERRAEKDPAQLRRHEREVLAGLFGGGERVKLDNLRNRFYKRIPAIRQALQERMVADGYFVGRADAIRRRWAGLGLAVGVVVFLLGLGWVKLRGGVMPHAVIVPLLSALPTALLFFAFAPAMPRRTRKGVELKSWARGFEEFVDRVESERLEADRRRNVFESLLPYAMALGVAAAWARRFEGIYQEARPAWYVGRQPSTGFSTRGFESNLSSAMGQTARAMASSPRSQGSSGSGGGSSGGGGGGGGGGSW